MLWPSTGAATSCLSLSWVIMRLPGRGIALVVSYGHRRGRGFAPSPICTIMLRPSTGAAASHLSLSWVIMRTTRARDRPGSKLWPSTGEGLCPVPHLYDNATAIDGSSHFVPVPKLGNNETTRARDRPGSKLWPSTGAATSCLSPIWVIMRTTRARDRPGSKLWPSTGEGLCPIPHLYDNATAVDGSSCFAPVPHLGNNEDYQGEGSPW